MGLAHRAQHQYRRQRDNDIGGCAHPEHGVPVTFCRDIRRQRYQQRGRALGGIEQAGVGGGVFRAIGVGTGGGEERIDLTPGKVDRAGADDEQDRVVAALAKALRG